MSKGRIDIQGRGRLGGERSGGLSEFPRAFFIEQMPDFHLPFAFDVNLADVFALEIIFQQFVRIARDLDAVLHAVTFHAARGVDHVAPYGKHFSATDHARDQRTRIQPDADLDGMFAAEKIPLVDSLQHIQRETREDVRVIGSGRRDACRRHVAVSRHLNFFRLVFLHQLIEEGEHIVEHFHYFMRTELRRDRREVDDVCEEHAGRVVFLRDGFVALF